ncbi:NHL repeat-containing protein [Rufibacter roseus]|uniref:Uncharacterized protein n=1 Tax=Rufibacter roseus TaxID=1567108 RepID=A0ABW2DL44_9BACT|nr:hypothetical protein [Rufibacter roseus]
MHNLTHLAKLPKPVVESSGLELAEQAGTYWTHNDAGNAPVLYKINEKGKLIDQITVPGTQNNDWEDLAKDTKGYLYIADTGNNNNKRRTLSIYKVSPKAGFKAQVINYTYQDQPEGKIPKKDRNFDCEAIFWYNSKLFLISKDRGSAKTAKLYQLPDQPGTHVAKLISKTELPGMVTSADVSPNGRHLAVLTYGKVYLYPVPKNSTQFMSQKPKILELQETGQVEAVAFKDNQTILISNEEGSLFKYSL